MVTSIPILSNTQMARGRTHGFQGTHIVLKLQANQTFARVVWNAQPKVRVLQVPWTYNECLFSLTTQVQIGWYRFFVQLVCHHRHIVMHSQVPGWTHLRVQLCVVAESWDSEGAPDFQHYTGVEGRARSPGIRPGRGTRRSSLNLHLKPTTRGLVHIRDTFGCWDKPRAL